MSVITGAVNEFDGASAGAAQFEAGFIDAVTVAGVWIALDRLKITGLVTFRYTHAVLVQMEGARPLQRLHFLSFACWLKIEMINNMTL